MKIISKNISTSFVILNLITCFAFVGCSSVEKYSLSVVGKELLYENLKDIYNAGEEVKAKVKIIPYENIIACLDLIPLTRTKDAQDDYFIFTFTMPKKDATLSIETIKGFEEDLLTGFHLTFYDKNENAIDSLNKEFDSPEAIANYYYFYYDEEFGNDVFTSNDGADVFADGKTTEMIDFAYGLKEFELESTFYFTYEILDAIAYVDWIYYNQQSRECSISSGVGFILNGIGIGSTHRTQNLSETRYTIALREYEATFDSKVIVNFQYLDYLTAVKVLEYDKNNELLKLTDFIGENRTESFTVGENCEYAVIEEEYTIMEGEHKNEKHYERTLIEKTAIGNGKTLKYPRGNGLISPIYLSIRWAN